jgi:uncharacterized protein
MAAQGTSVASWVSPKVKKGDPSRLHGRGLFAAEPIGTGEVVAVKGGHIVDTEALARLSLGLQNSEIQITERLHLAALTEDEYEAVMLFLNHSCEPNVGFAGNVVLVAMRDVAVDEELTTDYALFDTSVGEIACACGASTCRRRVTGQDWKLPELQARYSGYFSWYLQRRIDSGNSKHPRSGSE